MLIYQADTQEIEFPVIKKEKVPREFFFGVYCTLNKEDAEKEAKKLNLKVINIYEIKKINSLNIKVFKEYNNELLAFIDNCKYNIHNYDAIIIDNKQASFHTIKALDLIQFVKSYEMKRVIK